MESTLFFARSESLTPRWSSVSLLEKLWYILVHENDYQRNMNSTASVVFDFTTKIFIITFYIPYIKVRVSYDNFHFSTPFLPHNIRAFDKQNWNKDMECDHSVSSL